MEDNTILWIKLLLTGVSASLVTGIFSLVISIRNNSRLLKVEKVKQKYSMDSKKYELLNEYLNWVNEKEASFEYAGELEMTFQCVREIFCLRLDKFKFLEDEHYKHEYLFDSVENKNVREKIKKIHCDVDDYVDRFGGDSSVKEQDLVNYIDKIANGIDDFRNFYFGLIKEKMNKILNGE